MNFENDSDFNAGNIEGVKVLQITETEYNSDYNSVNATFEDVNGFKFFKTFYLNSKNPNEVAYGKKQLDFLAFKALGERCAYSEEDLVGKYIVVLATFGISVLISGLMVIFREDKRGIHDFIGGTYVSRE